VVQTIADCAVSDFSPTPPYTLTVQPDRDARAAINAGDWATVEDQRARILAVAPAAGATPPGDAAAAAVMPVRSSSRWKRRSSPHAPTACTPVSSSAAARPARGPSCASCSGRAAGDDPRRRRPRVPRHRRHG